MAAKDLSAHHEADDCGDTDELLVEDVISLDLVSALAGDRELTAEESAWVLRLREVRDSTFFTDLLFTITHQYFRPRIAEDLWNKILRHKYEMSSAMKRNIRISVASLDFLSNLEEALPAAKVVAEDRMVDIVRRSVRDGLTGLFNHAFFYRSLGGEIRRYERDGTAVSLVMADIDNFKAINDLHGHQEGDSLLAGVAAVIGLVARKSDTCCRYGGDEFAVILRSTDIADAIRLAERLRREVAEAPIGGRSITLSLGVLHAPGRRRRPRHW